MNRVKVANVEEAVETAKRLKRSGRSYWFRGQSKDWPIRSTLARVDTANRSRVLEKAARYEQWVKDTPGLENLAANVDAAIAVAQHYGLPTNFVDFTTEPDIAGFFASEKGGQTTNSDMACIICLDIDDLKQFWQNLPERYPPPEFLELAVPDLWRLEAQHGRFLFCPYDNIEHLYDFDRIYFPNTRVLGSLKREDVYPERKSHLEILLDQYFMNEQLIDAEAWRPKNAQRIVLETPAGRADPEIFPNGLTQHQSWSDAALRPWLQLDAEEFVKARTGLNFRIRIPNSQNPREAAKAVAGQLLHDLFGYPGVRQRLVGWDLLLDGDCGLPEDFASRLAPRLARLWDGLRPLPHSDADICEGLGLCVAFAVALGGDFHPPDQEYWDRAAQACLADPVELEFGAGDGSYSRGYASATALCAAVRADMPQHISDRWKHLARNVEGILQTSSDPRQTFDFQLLTPLFARQIAPCQVLARDSAVFYSPARLVSMGLP